MPQSICKKIQVYFLFNALFLFLSENSAAQIIQSDEMPRALYYYKMPRVEKLSEMKNLKDALHCDKYLMGRNVISGNISNYFGRIVVNDGQRLNEEFRYSLGFFTRIQIVEELSLNTTFFKHFNKRSDVRWIPDYTYAIGRFHWRPNTFNYGYENYGANKYTDNFKQTINKLKQGFFFISYSNLLSVKLTERIRVDETSNIRFTYFARYATHFIDTRDQLRGGLLNGKPYLGLAMRYTIAMNFYLESSVHYYFDAKRNKQPWDPDYSYGFGYFDYRSFRMSLSYTNWAINKFPWNEEQNIYPYYGFLDGTFRINFNYSW
jgi:hypothetical protein